MLTSTGLHETLNSVFPRGNFGSFPGNFHPCVIFYNWSHDGLYKRPTEVSRQSVFQPVTT